MPVEYGVEQALQAGQAAEHLPDKHLIEHQNRQQRRGELNKNADKKRHAARLVGNIRRALVLERGIVVRRLLRVAAQAAHPQQANKADSRQSAAEAADVAAVFRLPQQQPCEKERRADAERFCLILRYNRCES